MSVLSELVGDASVGVRANVAPAEIVVSSNLAEDTVVANPMDIAPGVNKQAMFANPFVGGSEEILFIDPVGGLQWARHVNPEGVAGVVAGDPVGWRQDAVATGAREVVVAVHPAGGVFAFALVASGAGVELVSFELVADATVAGGMRWARQSWLGSAPLVGLQVYYCTDRPATPFVFVRRSDVPRVLWFSALPGGGWRAGGGFDYDDQDRGRPAVFGVDSPLELGEPAIVPVVRMWSLFGNMLSLTSYYSADGGYVRQEVGGSHPWKQLLGAWAHPAGVGVVGVEELGGEIQLALPVATVPYVVKVPFLDRGLQDLVAWQDADNLLHVYGRDAEGSLCAVHQLGWAGDLYGRALPAWDSHPSTVPGGGQMVTTRPLVGQVARFVVDAFPDFMPNQHVMHQGVAPGEACAIYTQNVRTTFWATEKMRMLDPKDLPKPYAVSRYQTSLTVKNAFGSPIGGVGVQISADAALDLEVGGKFYRTGAVTPITLLTDDRGQVTLRVVATGLTLPDLYVTVPGLDQSVTVQMAADVHKFLAGDAALPNHRDGFTPTVVANATVPGTDTLLFAKLAPTPPPTTSGESEPDPWPPTAADLVAWCHGAFAVDTGGRLPAAMTARLGPDEQVLGFTIQTHDPLRVGFEVFTSADQLAARTASLQAVGGFFTESGDWLGDVWQGIREGVTALSEVLVDVETQTIEMVITLADGAINILQLAWNDPITAAHTIEAAFVAVGASIENTLHWLQWAFDFKDAFLTTKALSGGIAALGELLEPKLTEWEHLAHDFFVDKITDVQDAFATAKSGFQGQTAAALQTPPSPPPQTRLPGIGPALSDQAQGPHCNWLTDKIIGSTDATTSPEGSAGLRQDLLDQELMVAAGELFDDLIAILDASPAARDHMYKAAEDAGKLFSNLFDGGDAQTVLSKEIVTLLDLVENVVEAILQYAGDVVAGLLDWAKKALKAVAELLDTPLTDVPLLSVLWDFMVGRAGLPAKDHPLTVGSLGLMLGAYPSTILYKMVTGEAPFPDGKLSAIPTAVPPGSTAQLSEADRRALLGIQMFCCNLRSIEAVFTIYLDLKCLTPDKSVFPYSLRGPSPLASKAFAVSRLALYGLLEFPAWFMKPEGANHDIGGWVVYLPKAIYCLADVYTAFTKDTLLERYMPPPSDSGPNVGYQMLTSALGVMSLGLPWIGLAGPKKPTWYNIRYASTRAASALPWALGLARVFNDDMPYPPSAYVAVVADMVLGSAAVFYGGIQQVVFSLHQLHDPPQITADAQAIDLGDAINGQAFSSSADIEITGGFPAYTWDVVTDAGQTGPPVPGGQGHWSFEDAGSDPAYPGQKVKLQLDDVQGDSGVEYTFTLRALDAFYGPGSDQHTAVLTPWSPPVADFTAGSSGIPLMFHFQDTSANGATAWSWDFGDGTTSGEQNPIHNFPAPGEYQVSLTVNNPAGESAQQLPVKVF